MSTVCCILMSAAAWATTPEIFVAGRPETAVTAASAVGRRDAGPAPGNRPGNAASTRQSAVAPPGTFVAAPTKPQSDGSGREVSLLTTWDSTAGAPSGWRVFSEKAGAEGSPWQLGDDDILFCRGSPLGYLATKESYGDFILRLQWRWPQGKEGKGGVLINLSGEDRIWPKSLEAQINAGQAGDFWGLAGFEFTGPAERLKTIEHAQFGRLTHLPRTADAERPAGQWNDYEIRAEKEWVVLRINDREVNRANRGAAAAGPIVLTAEGSPIEFRNIRVQTLNEADQPRKPAH